MLFRNDNFNHIVMKILITIIVAIIFIYTPNLIKDIIYIFITVDFIL